MSLGYENVPVRRDEQRVRLIEECRVAPAARLAESHQQLARRTELEDLVTLGWRVGWRGWRAATPTAAGAPAVDHPDVVVSVNEDAVWREHESGAEVRHERAGRIELEHWVERGSGATVRAAPLGDPHAHTVAVDRDRARRSPGASFGHLGPARDRLIRIRRVVGRRHRRLGVQRRRHHADRERSQSCVHCPLPTGLTSMRASRIDAVSARNATLLAGTWLRWRR